MSGSGREALPDVREWSRGSLRIPGVVGRASRMSGSGQEALTMSRSGWESLLDVRQWS